MRMSVINPRRRLCFASASELSRETLRYKRGSNSFSRQFFHPLSSFSAADFRAFSTGKWSRGMGINNPAMCRWNRARQRLSLFHYFISFGIDMTMKLPTEYNWLVNWWKNVVTSGILYRFVNCQSQGSTCPRNNYLLARYCEARYQYIMNINCRLCSSSKRVFATTQNTPTLINESIVGIDRRVLSFDLSPVNAV